MLSTPLNTNNLQRQSLPVLVSLVFVVLPVVLTWPKLRNCCDAVGGSMAPPGVWVSTIDRLGVLFAGGIILPFMQLVPLMLAVLYTLDTKIGNSVKILLWILVLLSIVGSFAVIDSFYLQRMFS